MLTKPITLKWRSASSWSPFSGSKQKARKPLYSVTRKPRVKYVYLQISRSLQLVVSARYFRPNKARRSQAFKQWVIPTYLIKTKEISVRTQRQGRKKRAIATSRFYAPGLAPTLLIGIGMLGMFYFGMQYTKVTKVEPAQQFSFTPPTSPAAEKVAVAKPPLPKSKPTRVTIPAVGIDSKVITVGKLADGSMETPNSADITGWYKFSPTPGEVGPAIIVGHVDWIDRIAVFWRLRELKAGDTINVTREDGKIAKFKVIALKEFSQNNFPTKEVYGNLDYEGLRLITCGGTFSPASGHYSHNTVVFAKLIK